MSEKDNLLEADGTKNKEATEVKDPDQETGSNVPEASTLPQKTEEKTEEQQQEEDEALAEIDSNNAESAESESKDDDDENSEKEYKSMSMEELVEEMESLLNTEKIQHLKKKVENVKSAFNKQFSALLEAKKAEFLEQGGNSIDFKFDFPLKKRFNALFKSYREKRQSYYQNLEKSLKENLENRLEIIEEIKSLLNVEENINTTYKNFKALQERWRNAGPIPRDKYNNVWNNYHHHVENFYDFLHLNRDLRDLDFKHNLEQKTKIIERAEELAKEDDSNRAFRELQALHKMWKEELGPVAKEHREELWERFRNATKTIHEKRQHYFAHLDEAYQKNLEKKQEIIKGIKEITEDDSNNHATWQKKINKVEDLRQQFFNAGKVPIKVNEATWAKFKEAVRAFNRKKNQFYKSLKKDQYENLKKKMELIEIAEANKDNEDFSATTPIMKKIQSDWKSIGHVPRKDSDRIWNRFKEACNHYFDRLHQQRNEENKEGMEIYHKKVEALEQLKSITFTKDLNSNMELIREHIDNWKSLGRVPYNKRYIEGKFNKAINALYNQLDADKSEIEMLKFESKLESIVESDDKRQLDSERNYVRKKIDEIKSEINQLENNLQFFSHVEDDNPIVAEVHENIDKQKAHLNTWKQKLKRIKKFY